ncbi:MAG: RNA-directed DNA polymerase [Moorea sp. SIO3C2]|nr:RNA-directed DNA polymerase [Moorena sp. SIO3C2]
MMKNLKSSCSDLVNIEFQHIDKGFPDATAKIERSLRSELSSSELPCFSNVLVMQLNVISPFSQTYRNHQEDYDELRSLGIDIDGGSTEDNSGLGTSEALAYKQLIETVPIDVMHLVTVGTKNMEFQVQLGTNSKVTLAERIKEMIRTLHQIVGNRHTIDEISSDNHIVYFENPENCYWRDRDSITYHTDFYADFQTIWSADRAEDKDWNEVISLDNLKLAWARARRNLLSESLYDETEVRIFETNLDFNILNLQEQLCAYANDVVSSLVDQTISYKSPKNVVKTRPRGLSRIEEEILSVAIIQKLGDKSSQLRGSSYAYRISGKQRDTEYLYEYYFKAYRDYLNEAHDSAKNYPNGAVLRVDIESFYTKIIQEKLCDELSTELTESERVRWLIRLLLSKNIDQHELGQGITQGNIGSGFYANIYLTSVDAKFGSGNEWGVELHRYVDDMIFIIPNPEDMEVIENTVKDELHELGLNLNENKTERIYQVSSFLEQSDQDQCLDELSDRFDCVVNPLWIMNSEHRAIFKSAFHKDELWWYHIHHYQQCLREIKIYINDTDLSHKIYKYLHNAKGRERDLAKQKDVFGLEGELKYTQLPYDESFKAIRQWSASFITSNNVWSKNRDELRKVAPVRGGEQLDARSQLGRE